MFKKALIGIIIFGAVSIALLQLDDDLIPEVAELIERNSSSVDKKSDAYLYLLGIEASENEDPLVVGKQVFASMRQAEDSYGFGEEENFEYNGYPEHKKLTLPNDGFLCTICNKDKLNILYPDKEESAKLLNAHKTLYKRYQTFIKMTDYQTLSKPSIVEVLPPYRYLMVGNRLTILNGINIASAKGPQLAVNMLKDNVSALRYHLKGADNFIAKMVYTTMISDNLDALSILFHQYGDLVEDKFDLITVDERSFEAPLEREFMMAYEMYNDLDRNPEFFARAGQGGKGSAPGWWVRMWYKPNMTINQSYAWNKKVITRSKLKQKDFSVAVMANKIDRAGSESFSIRNYIGSVLSNIAKPDFDSYISRVFDLNTKISLFNQTSNKSDLSALEYIQNPYFNKPHTAYYTEDGKSICLTGPLDDDKNQRCLRVKL